MWEMYLAICNIFGEYIFAIAQHLTNIVLKSVVALVKVLYTVYILCNISGMTVCM